MSRIGKMLVSSGIAAMTAIGLPSPLDMAEDETHAILRGPPNEGRGKKESSFDARKFLDEARARQDHKRQARAIAKHSGGYLR